MLLRNLHSIHNVMYKCESKNFRQHQGIILFSYLSLILFSIDIYFSCHCPHRIKKPRHHKKGSAVKINLATATDLQYVLKQRVLKILQLQNLLLPSISQTSRDYLPQEAKFPWRLFGKWPNCRVSTGKVV